MMARFVHWALWPLAFLSLTACGATTPMTQLKFDWQATDSAPRNYPMEIVAGHLFYPEGGSLYVPDKSTIAHGWGEGGSSHIVGPELKPLPHRLGISFFSYTENQFYGGRFDLPYDTIVQRFKEGYYSPNEPGHVTYDEIVVGVAPGGAVAVWLRGIDRTTEVFFGHAQKEEGRWTSIIDNPAYTREEFIRSEIESSLTPEALASLRKNGVPLGRWDSYRTRYRWQPVFTGMTVRDHLIYQVHYYNGEKGYLYAAPAAADANTPLAVPSHMAFIWARTKVNGLKFKLFFDETEIFNAFKQLGSQNQTLQLETRMERIMREGEAKLNFTVWLRNEKEAIELKQTRMETYGVPDLKE